MLYIISTIIAIVFILFFIFISIYIDYKNIKNINILSITLASMLISLSVILTNVIGYNILIFKKIFRLSFGNFIIFVLGMLLGPFIGVLGGIASDLLGILINISGKFHVGFTLNLILYGFFGSIVFLKKDRFWYMRVIILYTLVFIIISFVLNTFWLYSIGWESVILKGSFIIKLIKFPIEVIIYIILVLTSFVTIYNLLINHNIDFWAMYEDNSKKKFFQKNTKK